MTITEFMILHSETQSRMAARVGISRSYLAEIASGSKRPGRDTIEKIVRATGGAVPASVWFEHADHSPHTPSHLQTGDAVWAVISIV